jgi:hypothetical protein
MSDMNLLLFGIVVFGLMLVGVVLTLAEFRQISNDDMSGLGPQPDSNDSKSRSKNRH